eukprot:g6375.t1
MRVSTASLKPGDIIVDRYKIVRRCKSMTCSTEQETSSVNLDNDDEKTITQRFLELSSSVDLEKSVDLSEDNKRLAKAHDRNYEVKDRLGSGGEGDVFLATGDEEKEVVLKFSKFSPPKKGMFQMDESFETAKNTYQEKLKTAANKELTVMQDLLGCEGVLQCVKKDDKDECDTFNDENGVPVIILKKYDMDLFDYITEEEDGLLQNVMEIILKMWEGLKCMHDKFYVHLDIKPENVLIKMNEEKEITDVVLADFGLSEKLNEKYFCKNGKYPTGRVHPHDVVMNGKVISKGDFEVRGTPAYLSPELAMQTDYCKVRKVAKGLHLPVQSSDIWALGLTTLSVLSTDFFNLVSKERFLTRCRVRGIVSNYVQLYDEISGIFQRKMKEVGAFNFLQDNFLIGNEGKPGVFSPIVETNGKHSGKFQRRMSATEALNFFTIRTRKLEVEYFFEGLNDDKSITDEEKKIELKNFVKETFEMSNDLLDEDGFKEFTKGKLSRDFHHYYYAVLGYIEEVTMKPAAAEEIAKSADQLRFKAISEKVEAAGEMLVEDKADEDKVEKLKLRRRKNLKGHDDAQHALVS